MQRIASTSSGGTTGELLFSIYLNEGRIQVVSQETGIPRYILREIVMIHEYAHLIHYILNPDRFLQGHPLFPSRSHFVEGWAQLCTYLVLLDRGPELLAKMPEDERWIQAFWALNLNQPTDYHFFRHFLSRRNYRDETMQLRESIELFLFKHGWARTYFIQRGFAPLWRREPGWAVLVQELNLEKDIHVELRHEFSKARADLSRQFIQNRLTQPLQEAIRPSEELIDWLRAFGYYGEIAEIDNDLEDLGF